MKQIFVNEKEFEILVKELEKCKEEREELQKAVNFLNEQIKEYNSKLAKDENEN